MVVLSVVSRPTGRAVGERRRLDPFYFDRIDRCVQEQSWIGNDACNKASAEP